MKGMKRILILGTGNAQVDAVRFCKEWGLFVYACSYNSFGRATALADQFELIDITDINKVKAYTEANNIDAVYSVGSDIAMPTACAVSEQLALPHFVTFETAQTCMDKANLRKSLGLNGGGNIKYQMITGKGEQINIPYPFIMKPVDSQGQRGVRLIKNFEEFEKHFDTAKEFSRAGKVIIEEYIDGPEMSVNTYVYNNEIIFFAISDRVSWEQYPGGIIHKHILPSRILNHDANKAVLDLVQETIQILSIENGPVYFQIKLQDNEPKLIEVTPRLDGCHMWWLYTYSTCIDLLEVTFKHLLGALPKPETCLNPEISNAYSLEFFCEVPGKHVDYSKYSTKDALYLEWYYNPGEKVMPINGFFEKIGYVIRNDN